MKESFLGTLTFIVWVAAFVWLLQPDTTAPQIKPTPSVITTLPPALEMAEASQAVADLADYEPQVWYERWAFNAKRIFLAGRLVCQVCGSLSSWDWYWIGVAALMLAVTVKVVWDKS